MSTVYSLKNIDQSSYEYDSINKRWILAYPNNTGASIWSNDTRYSIALTHGVYDGPTLIGEEFQTDVTISDSSEEILYGFGRIPYNSPYGSVVGLPFDTLVTGKFTYWKSTSTSITDFPNGYIQLDTDLWTLQTPKEILPPSISITQEDNKIKISVSDHELPSNEKGISYKWNFYQYQVSINEGPWELWKSSTSKEEYYEDLVPGSIYKFRVITQVNISRITLSYSDGSKNFNVLSEVTSNEENITTSGTRPIVSTSTFKDAYKWKFAYYPIRETSTEQTFKFLGTMEAQSNWGSYNQTVGQNQYVELVREDGSQTANLFNLPNAYYTYALYDTNQSQAGTEFYLNSTKTPPNGDLGWQDLGTVTIPKDKQVRKWSLHFVMEALEANLTIPDVLEVEQADIAPTLEDIIDVKSTQESITATFVIKDWGSSKVNTYSARALMFDTADFSSTFYYKNEKMEGLEPESFTYTFTNNSLHNGSPSLLQPNKRFYLTFEATRADITNNSREIVKEVYTQPKNYIEFEPGNTTPTYNTASVEWYRDTSYSQDLVETKKIWYRADNETEWTLAYSGEDNSGTLNLTNLQAGRRYEFRSSVTTEAGTDTIDHGYILKTATVPSNPKDLNLYWNKDLITPIATFRCVTTSNDKKELFTPELSNGRAGTMLARRTSENEFQLEASIIATGHEPSITDSSQAIGLKMIPNNEQLLKAFNEEYNRAYSEITWNKPSDSYLDNYNYTGSMKKMYGVNIFRIPYTYSIQRSGLKITFNAEDQTITVNGTLTTSIDFTPLVTDISANHNWMVQEGPYYSEGDFINTSIYKVSGSIDHQVSFVGRTTINDGANGWKGTATANNIDGLLTGNPSSFKSTEIVGNDGNQIRYLSLWSNTYPVVLTNYTFRVSTTVTNSQLTEAPEWTYPERFGVLPYSGNDYVGYYHVDENEFSDIAPNIKISMKRTARFDGEPDISDFKEILTEPSASMTAGSWVEFDNANQTARLIDDLSIYSHRALELVIKNKETLETYTSTALDYATDFIPGHKYFITFKAKSNQSTTLETFWPAEAGHSTTYNINGDNKWHDINAIFTATAATSTDFRFRFDNNQSYPPHDNQIVRIAMPILIDLSLPLGVGKEPPIKWCETNLTYDLFYPNPSEAQLLNENDTQEKKPDWTYFISEEATQSYSQPVYAEKATDIPSDPQTDTIYFITDNETEDRKEIEFKNLYTEDEFSLIAPQPNKIYYITENDND